MNAKEEVLRELKARKYELKKEITSMLKDRFSEDCIEYKIVNSFLERIESLITAVENAIFDVPSEEEIKKVAIKQSEYYCFLYGLPLHSQLQKTLK
jgi:hypothetical protein